MRSESPCGNGSFRRGLGLGLGLGLGEASSRAPCPSSSELSLDPSPSVKRAESSSESRARPFPLLRLFVFDELLWPPECLAGRPGLAGPCVPDGAPASAAFEDDTGTVEAASRAKPAGNGRLRDLLDFLPFLVGTGAPSPSSSVSPAYRVLKYRLEAGSHHCRNVNRSLPSSEACISRIRFQSGSRCSARMWAGSPSSTPSGTSPSAKKSSGWLLRRAHGTDESGTRRAAAER